MSEILVTTVAEIMVDTKTSENCRNRQFGIGFAEICMFAKLGTNWIKKLINLIDFNNR